MGLLGKGVNKIGGAAKGLLDEVADMLFIHGTDADKLKLYDAIGGQPMPSLAVTQKDIPFDWGDIDLIGKKGSFSPESNSLNDLYSTDAYTVRSNMPLRKAKEDAGDLFRKRFGNVGHYASELDNSDLASVEIDDYFNGRFGMGPTKFAEEKGIPAVKKPDGSTSHIKTKHFIRDNHGPEYSEWIQEQMDYLFEPEIYRMKLGKMVPYDVEDVTEEMVKKRGIGAEGVFDTTGYSKATEATKFKSLNEAKAARSALMEKSIADTKYNEMDYEGVAPTQYFESKPARSVGFKEYAGAIVPEHVDDKTLKILKDRGLHIEKYATPDERLAARGKFKSEMFTRPVTAAATGLLGLGALAQSDESEAGVVGGILGDILGDFAGDTVKQAKKAGWTDERISRAIRDMSHVRGDVAKGRVGHVNPKEFVEATHPDYSQIKKEAGLLDVEKLRNEDQIPFINVEDGKIVGHEGRHRMAAMHEQGIDSAPVMIRDVSGYSSENVPAQKFSALLEGQDLADGKVGKPLSVTDTILASKSNKGAIKGLMGDSDLLYSSPIMGGTAGLLGLTALAPDDVRAAEIAATDIRDVGSIQAPRSQGAATAANLANRYNRAVQNAGPIGLLAPEAPESLIRKSAYGDKRGLMDYIGAALGML